MKNTKKILTAGIGTAMALTFVLGSTASADSGPGKNMPLSASANNQIGLSTASHDKGNDNNEDGHGRIKHEDGKVRDIVLVTSISGNEITAKDVLGNANRTWNIQTDDSTGFMSRIGDKISLSEVNVGDTITFQANLANGVTSADSAGTYTVDAYTVRDWGNVDLSSKVHTSGTVTNVDDDNYQLTIDTSDGQTITVDASDLTKVGDSHGDHQSFDDITTGMTVQLKGFWNSVKDGITAFKIRFM